MSRACPSRKMLVDPLIPNNSTSVGKKARASHRRMGVGRGANSYEIVLKEGKG